ncbi:MAG: hypothetical protein K5679_00030 [Lachnospiraceae bacterium]|nr:hypothetical protein [Lachnospiraceae bacterium]
MNNRISVDKVLIQGCSIEYKFCLEGDWKKAFNSESMRIEYSIDVSSVPESIAVIPLLANILPIAWVYDAKIAVRECDKSFYDSIADFKKGYKDMYPMLELKGEIEVGTLVDNKATGDGTVAFFSGGVDAFNTLVKHATEKPTLVTLWGADVKLSDAEGWKNVETHILNTAEEFGIDFVSVKSEFRDFIKMWTLTAAVEKSGDDWWHGFQHGIGIICHAAPIAYVLGKSTVYFASSFTAADKGKVKCASDPTIDNFVRFCGARVVHDGYEYDRQAKIHNIVEYAKESGRKIALRVCWEATGGSNCCKCEKCWRTLLGVYAEGENPNNYGFDYESFPDLCKLIYKKRELLAWHRDSRYAPIQKRMRELYTAETVEPNLKWFYNINLDSLELRYFRKTLGKRIVNKIKWVLKKN